MSVFVVVVVDMFLSVFRGVFHASCRRAFFYSVYTWLTHTILAVPVSILPSGTSCIMILKSVLRIAY